MIRQLFERRELRRFARHAASILVLFALLATGASAQRSQPPAPSGRDVERQPQAQQPAPTQNQPAPIERGTVANPLVVRESRSQDQAAEYQQDRQDEQASRRYALWLSIVTTVVIGFQVWLLVYQNKIIAGQSAIMKEQAVHMRDGLTETRRAAKAAEDGATAARRSARAAVASVKIARSSIVNTQRAFLTFTRFDFEQFFTPTSKLTNTQEFLRTVATALVQNTGHTPALKARSVCALESVPIADVDSHGLSAIAVPDHQFKTGLTAPPQLEFGGGSVVFTRQLVEDVVANKIALFVHVIIEYRDFFQGTPIHHTTACLRIGCARVPTKVTPGREVYQVVFGPSAHHSAD